MKAMSSAMGWAAALVFAAGMAAAEMRSTGTTERAYVMTQSSVIDGACYDAARHELTLFFRVGSAYLYRDVPELLFRSLVRSDSPGHFYHEHVRGRFPSRRLTDRELFALVERHDGRTTW